MNYLYVKAFHIIFIVTWFAGLFYIVRLFIYLTEAQDKPEPEKTILTRQFEIMTRRLWLGITWPSAIITLLLGPTMWYLLMGGFNRPPKWLEYKMCFVLLLYAYHFSLHHIYKLLMKGEFKYTSQQLRIWNEVATVFLFAIVLLAAVKEGISLLYGFGILAALIAVLLVANVARAV
ncbi:MAG: protoporphyrinogen IX oxidase [Chitinophagia bacterium]|nr:protoporphyrinogen IX oxidase [Chitinophagia bacterium]